MEPGVSVQKQNFTRNPEKLARVPGTREETKSHLHWQLLVIQQILWRSLLESLHDYTTQIRNEWDCWKGSAQSKRRHLCCIVAIVSKWKVGGGFYGMLHPSVKRHKSINWLKEVLGNRLRDRLCHLVHWLSIILKLRRISQESINWKESLTWIVGRIRSVRGVNLGGWRTDRRLWGVGDDRRIRNLFKKTQWERGDISPKRRIYFSDRRWSNPTPWRRSRSQNIHLDTEATSSRRKSRWFSLRIRRVSSTTSRSFPRILSWRRSKSGPMKRPIWSAQKLRGSISLTRRKRNSKKPSRIVVRNLKHLWLSILRRNLLVTVFRTLFC